MQKKQYTGLRWLSGFGNVKLNLPCKRKNWQIKFTKAVDCALLLTLVP
jgi:hypothetical protein